MKRQTVKVSMRITAPENPHRFSWKRVKPGSHSAKDVSLLSFQAKYLSLDLKSKSRVGIAQSVDCRSYHML